MSCQSSVLFFDDVHARTKSNNKLDPIKDLFEIWNLYLKYRNRNNPNSRFTISQRAMPRKSENKILGFPP